MASQAIYVDLDLKGNELLNVGDASVGTSAPNLDQVEALITTGGWTPAAAATAAGLGLTSSGSTIDVSVGLGTGLEADESGLWVNVGAGISVSPTGGLAVNLGDGLFLDVDDVAVDPAFVQGIVDTTVDAIDYPVDSIVGTAPITAVDDGTGIYTIGINASALDFPVDSVGVTSPITNTGTASDPVIGVDIAVLSTTLDATFATDAELNAGLALKANAATAVTAGAGLTGGGTLAAPFSVDVVAIDGSIAVAADGISVAPGGITGDKLATEAVGNINLGANLYGLIDVQRLTTDPASAQNGYVLTYDNTVSQWVGKIPATVDYPVENVLGTAGQVVVTESPADTFVVALDPTITTAITNNTAAIGAETTARTNADTALQAEIDAVEGGLTTETAARISGDAAINTRIDGISVVGTGAASVTEDTPDHFTVHVDSLTLSNTYSGTAGIDDATIEADIAPEVAEAGDLYVNSLTGQAFIYDGDSWTELSTATAGLNSVASGDGSLVVTNGGGPAADLVLDPLLKSQITTSTTTNGAQDTAILALQGDVAGLEAATHVAAVSGNAGIGVVAGTQAVSLVVDPLATELTIGAAGLTVDLAAYATDTDLSGAVAALEGADAALAQDLADEIATRSGADVALDGRLDALELSQPVQDGRLDAIEAEQIVQNGDIADLEAKHASAPFVLDGLVPQDVTGPAGGTVTVRDAGGCIITISVCESVAGTYTLMANSAVSGTVTFG